MGTPKDGAAADSGLSSYVTFNYSRNAKLIILLTFVVSLLIVAVLPLHQRYLPRDIATSFDGTHVCYSAKTYAPSSVAEVGKVIGSARAKPHPLHIVGQATSSAPFTRCHRGGARMTLENISGTTTFIVDDVLRAFGEGPAVPSTNFTLKTAAVAVCDQTPPPLAANPTDAAKLAVDGALAAPLTGGATWEDAIAVLSRTIPPLEPAAAPLLFTLGTVGGAIAAATAGPAPAPAAAYVASHIAQMQLVNPGGNAASVCRATETYASGTTVTSSTPAAYDVVVGAFGTTGAITRAHIATAPKGPWLRTERPVALEAVIAHLVATAAAAATTAAGTTDVTYVAVDPYGATARIVEAKKVPMAVTASGQVTVASPDALRGATVGSTDTFIGSRMRSATLAVAPRVLPASVAFGMAWGSWINGPATKAAVPWLEAAALPDVDLSAAAQYLIPLVEGISIEQAVKAAISAVTTAGGATLPVLFHVQGAYAGADRDVQCPLMLPRSVCDTAQLVVTVGTGRHTSGLKALAAKVEEVLLGEPFNAAIAAWSSYSADSVAVLKQANNATKFNDFRRRTDAADVFLTPELRIAYDRLSQKSNQGNKKSKSSAKGESGDEL